MRDHKIEPIAYCPIARGANTLKCPDICEHPTVKICQEKYGKTGAQILLNWGIQRGHIVIPKSNNESRVKENIESLNFTLDKEDVEAISKLDEGVRICDDLPWLGNHSIFA